LGTVDLAAAYLHAIEANTPTKIRDEDGLAVLLLAFLHDTFHGPFGHALDLCRDLLWPVVCQDGARPPLPSGPRADKALLAAAVHEAAQGRGALFEAVQHFVCGCGEKNHTLELFQTLKRLMTPSERRRSKSSTAYLKEIVDGCVDADRLDYLWRDGRHLMATEKLEVEDVHQILSGVRLLPVSGGDPDQQRLHFHEEHLGLISKVLRLRRVYYLAYYENSHKRVLDEMLVHALAYSLPTLNQSLGNTSDRLLLLADDELLTVLRVHCAQEGLEIPRLLLEDLTCGKGFTILKEEGVPISELEDIAARYDWMSRTVENEGDFQKALASEAEVDAPGGSKSRIPPPTHEKLFWLQNLYGGGFRKKFRLEAALWAKVLCANECQGSLTAMAQLLARDRLSEMAQLLKTTPLLFLSVSWIPSASAGDLLAHSRGYGEDKICVHRDGQSLGFREVPIPLSGDDIDYPLLLCCPEPFASGEAANFLIRTLDELVQGCYWARECFPLNWLSEAERTGYRRIVDQWQLLIGPPL
jgi:hypothetical protein